MSILNWIKQSRKERKPIIAKQHSDFQKKKACESIKRGTCERWVVILKEEKGYKGNCKDFRWIAEGLGWNGVDNL